MRGGKLGWTYTGIKVLCEWMLVHTMVWCGCVPCNTQESIVCLSSLTSIEAPSLYTETCAHASLPSRTHINDIPMVSPDGCGSGVCSDDIVLSFVGKRRYSIKLWKTFTDCFNTLPIAAVIDDKIFCCHGGTCVCHTCTSFPLWFPCVGMKEVCCDVYYSASASCTYIWHYVSWMQSAVRMLAKECVINTSMAKWKHYT